MRTEESKAKIGGSDDVFIGDITKPETLSLLGSCGIMSTSLF